jgi:hypothetical protein
LLPEFKLINCIPNLNQKSVQFFQLLENNRAFLNFRSGQHHHRSIDHHPAITTVRLPSQGTGSANYTITGFGTVDDMLSADFLLVWFRGALLPPPPRFHPPSVLRMSRTLRPYFEIYCDAIDVRR